MKIGGLQRVSLSDFPGRICAVVFTQGCNFRCPYCHNPELVDKELFGTPLPTEEVLAFLKNRKGRLEGVTVTGGEPTLQPDLPTFLGKVKELGLEVKLDTNGSSPEIIARLIKEKLVDYLALDLKGPIDKYEAIVRVPVDRENIRQTAETIKSSGLEYEFRTTVVPSLLSKADVVEMARSFQMVRLYALQRFIPSKTLDRSYSDVTIPEDELSLWAKDIEKYATKVIVR